jgi:hypothetical protein
VPRRLPAAVHRWEAKLHCVVRSLDYAQRPGSSIAASSLQPTDVSCILAPPKRWSSRFWTREPGNIAHLRFDAVPRRDLGKSVEESRNRIRNMAQSDAIAISMVAEGNSGSGVRCPQAHAGGHLCRSYRAAHHRSCREGTSILDPQKGRREAQQRTYTQTLRPTIRKRTTKG